MLMSIQITRPTRIVREMDRVVVEIWKVNEDGGVEQRRVRWRIFLPGEVLVVISLEYTTTFENPAVKFEVRSVLWYWGIFYGTLKLMHAGACQQLFKAFGQFSRLQRISRSGCSPLRSRRMNMCS